MLEPYHDQRIVMRIVSWSPCYCFWVCVLSLHYRRAEPETRVYIRLLESLKALKDTRGGSPMDWKCKSLLRWAEVPSKPKPAQTLFDMRTAGVGYYYLGDLFHWLRTSCLDLHQNCYAHSTHAYLTKFKQLWEDEWWGENCSVVTADTEVPILRVKAFPARVPLLIFLSWMGWCGVARILMLIILSLSQCFNLALSLSFPIPMSESPIIKLYASTLKNTRVSPCMRKMSWQWGS